MTDIWQPGKTYVPGALVKPSSTTTVAQPQPTNGDFETGNLTGWSQGASRWANTSTTPYAGTKCVVLSGTGIDSLNNTNIVPVRVGQRITAQAMAKLTNNGTNDQGAQIIIVWLDASNVEIPGAATLGTLIYGQGGYWKPTTATGTAPAGAAKAFIRLNGDNGTHGGTLEFDQVSWDYAYQAPPPGLIFKATQAAPGKSGSAEPTWPTTAGISVTDNAVTWQGVIASRVVWKASPIMQTGATEPVWPTVVGAIVHDGNMDWIAVSSQITDPNCPHSKVVAIMASKVFAADKDIVRFSATVNPLDWSSAQDAGYLPTGLQQANSNDMAVLAPYRSNLTAFNASSFQNWQVDPDPAAMSLLDQLESIGSTWQHAAQPVGNDLFYLSQLGVRSVGIAVGTDNLAAGDIGMPVDVLVRASVSLLNDGIMPCSTYYPSAGQYWISFQHLTLQLTGGPKDGAIGNQANGSYRVSGAVRGYSVAVVSGGLPSGITLLATGTYSGAYTTAGTYTWTVRATDGAGRYVDLEQSLTVNPGVVIALLHFDTDMTTDATGRAWTVSPWTEGGYDPKLTWPQWDGSTYASGPGSFRMSRAGTTQWPEQGFYYGQARMYSALGTSGAIDSTTDFCVEGLVRRDPGDDNSGGNTMFLDFGIQLWAAQSNPVPRSVSLQNVPAGMTVTYTTVDRTIPTDRFIHFALVRAGSTITLWWGGQAAATVSSAQLLTLASTFPVSLGTSQNSYTAWQMPGWLDEIRITKGWARYTQAFTPPSGPVGSGTTPAVTIDQSTADVYVHTLNGGKGKWSRYLFPWSVDAFAQRGNNLYIRHGDEVSVVSEDVATDNVAGVPTNFAGLVQWAWLDNGQPGVTKMLESLDYVGTGQGPSLSIGYDQRDASAFTTPYLIDPDTLPGDPIPIPVAAPTFSIKLDFAGGKAWTVNAVTLHLDAMRGQP